ncbi:MAG: hypothetical protein QGH51_00530 [Planctomycetota bacterium]|jgi:hypothetical protein|nr:hypothetical protein [Planctomycetota bacterium]MDP6940491.1 hypothetical protein [Planctomycetota bacterium]
MLLFLLSLASFPQATPSRPIAPHQPEAVQLLDKAAKKQNGTKRSDPIGGFHLNLNIRERGQSRNDYDLELDFAAGREQIRISLEDSKRSTRISKGFDGKSYWLKEPDNALLHLDGREFSQDREAIEQAIEFSNRLLLLLDFKYLPEACEGLWLRENEAGPSIRGSLLLHGELTYFYLILNPETLLTDRLRIGKPALDEKGTTIWEGSEPVFTQLTEYELLHYRDFKGLYAPQILREFHILPAPIPKADSSPKTPSPSRIVEVHGLDWQNPPNTSPPK